ncbi:hypothetical protein CDO73_06680 [Saccharibacillus sp. O23]|uniref:hypothetical protein n=1 Tax=Saccharibacillus sp. O23 TaxID=2009338 RepID=UPI000B4E442C|nr:hypothetical protein [Saccharibacillus sp. O23]OWR31410.1 hypothetical protein CDO73_06680 [Saccharibacillus sp. O23]
MGNESLQKTKQAENDAAFAHTAEMQGKMDALRAVAMRLERAGVEYAIGGSGMLLGLGLAEAVRDWDLMTDAPEAEVRAALSDLEVTSDSGTSELYGSGSKLTVEGLEPEVEVIVGFAIRSGREICRLPALSGGVRRGLRIASPEVWFAAYALMGRTEKAALLETYLRERGADAAAVARLREEPLPPELAQRLDLLPIAEN